MTIKNGDEVKDRVTGFQGIVVATTTWLNGCQRMSVQPQKLKDGKIQETCSFDIEQLELVKTARVPGFEAQNRERTGGPCPDPVRRAEVRR